MEKMKILVGSPVRQDPRILKEFLDSLAGLKKENLQVDYCFVDDNVIEESSKLLRNFNDGTGKVIIFDPDIIEDKLKCNDTYTCDDDTHHWTINLTYKVGAFKDKIIDYAESCGYDFLFFIDSDILLYPQTLEHLVSTKKDIVSEIHWTQWTDKHYGPNVWLYDQADCARRERGQKLTKAEYWLGEQEFQEELKNPGTFPIGGLCACTLVSRKAIVAGVRFKEVYNLTLMGEDRHFCVRAAVLGFQLYVDTYYPGYHIYREGDLDGVAEYKRKTLESLRV